MCEHCMSSSLLLPQLDYQTHLELPISLVSPLVIGVTGAIPKGQHMELMQWTCLLDLALTLRVLGTLRMNFKNAILNCKNVAKPKTILIVIATIN